LLKPGRKSVEHAVTGPLISAAIRGGPEAIRFVREEQRRDRAQRREEEKELEEFWIAIDDFQTAVEYKQQYRQNHPTIWPRRDELRKTFRKFSTYRPGDKTGRYQNKEISCTAYLCIGILFMLEDRPSNFDVKQNFKYARQADKRLAEEFFRTEIFKRPKPQRSPWGYIALGAILVAVIGSISFVVLNTLSSSQSVSNLPTQVSPTSTVSHSPTPAPIMQESLKVFFAKGTRSITTTKSYEGMVTITIKGVAQSSGVPFADAFYVFGTPLSPPTHNASTTLQINGEPVDAFLKPIPAYRADHTYTFTIKVPSGHLTFGVGNGLAVDKTGFFTVTVRSSGQSLVNKPIIRDVTYFRKKDVSLTLGL
jgi:hypothetical protein